MCGIVGLFLKDRSLDARLGGMLSDMLVTMTDRGPDSAGIAIYGDGSSVADNVKVTIQSPTPEDSFDELDEKLAAHLTTPVKFEGPANDTHAILTMSHDAAMRLRGGGLRAVAPEVKIMSVGETIEIYKEVGLPAEVTARFNIGEMKGGHGIGHTRMATESIVTTMGAHPFNTGSDQCLVHNGSLSNHNALRRKLTREGIHVETENDSEVAAAYLTWRMREGANLGEALESALKDLDGFFTFVVGTSDGFGVVRDPIACKPAVMAETDGYVAFGSEYRALAVLPGIEKAKVWEPEPETVYFWNR